VVYFIFRITYIFLLYLLTPFILLRLYWWRGRHAPLYRQRWRERFAYIHYRVPRGCIWVHVVSVGETIAAKPLIKKIQTQFPDTPLLITSMTPNGSKMVQSLWGDTVHHYYLPYDYPGCIARFLNATQPAIAIIMETELWPNLLHGLWKNNIPVIIANARLSEKSFKHYHYFKAVTEIALPRIAKILVQYSDDAARFARLGTISDQVVVMGNMKFDMEIPSAVLDAAKTWRASHTTGGARPVWIAASTHPAEEPLVLTACLAAKKAIPNVLCIWVPRHSERFDPVAVLCQTQGLHVARRSLNEAVGPDTDIYLGDTFGELMLWYACADVAFVGGSFSQTGGHNILEPAAVSLPVIVGPDMFNFSQITDLMLKAHACCQLQHPDLLAETLISLLHDPAKQKQMGEHARAVFEAHQGALDRLWAQILPYLKNLHGTVDNN